MKNFLLTLTLSLLTILSQSASAQTIYNITSDITVASAKIPEQCDNCIINISAGVTLTVNKALYLKNTSFNGGTIDADKKITFWSNGAFNDVKVIVKHNAAIVSSAPLKIKKSEFVFNGNATATFWSTVDMDNSRMKFLENASMESTAPFNMKNSSSLTAGDGTPSSKAFIHFNGGTLNVYDDSYVAMAASNNYYYNWSNYNAVTINKSYKTTNNNINCGTSGKNPCSAPLLYGPATLNYAGVASSAILPVKLSAFSVKQAALQIELTWTTDMEQQSERFDIERSFDGIKWTVIGSVKAKGNSAVVSRYAYSDVMKVSGAVSYRLKMVDIDQSFAYSPIRTVKSESGVEMNIFPNPATNYIVISSKDQSAKNVQLFNQNGQVVKQVNGAGNINVTVSDLQTGNYIVRVSNAMGSSESFKLMIKK